jgi:hypothetical protein
MDNCVLIVLIKHMFSVLDIKRKKIYQPPETENYPDQRHT